MRKVISPVLAFLSVISSAAIAFGTYFINEVGWPFAWLRYEWREPSYVETIQYKGLWLDFFFWLAMVLILLALIKRLCKFTFSMKRIILVAMALVVLALDWAALHDIFKGEPSPYGEYALLIFSPLLLGAIIFLYRRVWE